MGWLCREFGRCSGNSFLIGPLTTKSVRLTLRGALHPSSTMSVRAMSQSESFDPARLVLYLPNCQKCGARMWLVRIEADAPGHDNRIFECPQCENVVSETFKYR
jgi:hypothetical protein